MEQILDLAVTWWAAADASTHVAAIVAGLIVLVTLLFMIIGAHTNPTRRPANEWGFRQFAEARMAAEAESLRAKEAKLADEPAESESVEAAAESPKPTMPRAFPLRAQSLQP